MNNSILNIILVTVGLLGGAGGVLYNLPDCPSSGYFHNCFGTYTWADTGDKYVGEFRYRKDGQGTYTFGPKSPWAGDKYIGEFSKGEKTGKGIYIFASGNKYVGELGQ